jgi:putative hydrolase of the HAD superfamily
MQSLSNRVVCFDLDDTLYKERDYLRSAFREIAAYVTGHYTGSEEDNYNILITAFENGASPFQEINAKLNIDVPTEYYLRMYRQHRPSICLSAEALDTLTSLKNKGYILGLITDGRSITQRNKIAALGLGRLFSDDNIIISEEFGSEKPSEGNYLYFVEKYPKADFVYVGDNLKKDFIAPKKLDWYNICLLDDGQNIHRQDFKISEPFTPNCYIHTLAEIIDIIS